MIIKKKKKGIFLCNSLKSFLFIKMITTPPPHRHDYSMKVLLQVEITLHNLCKDLQEFTLSHHLLLARD